MSRNQRWREEFLVAISREGVPLHVARKVLRHAATLQRLAEAQCNGDWPADNGTPQRSVTPCPLCESLWVRSVITGGKAAIEAHRLARLGQPLGTTGDNALRISANGWKPTACPDCRASARVSALVAPYGLKAYFAGDPRGAVVSLVRADMDREAFESGRERGISVPS